MFLKDCNAGFNFAFADEAKKFHHAVCKVLGSYKSPAITTSPIVQTTPNVNPILQKSSAKVDKSKFKMKVNKDLISGPLNCKHVAGYEIAMK